MFEISKLRKDCIICKRPIFKNERYFRTHEKGKSICFNCLINAQEAIKEKKVWIEHNEDYKIVYNEDDILNCSICSSHKKENILISIRYSYSVRGWRSWRTSWANTYLCKDCLDKFIASLTKEEIATADINRLERAIATL